MFAGVGERTREGNDLYKEMIESVSLLWGLRCHDWSCCVLLWTYSSINPPAV